jgi:addiction module RelE/StbE family toxin
MKKYQVNITQPAEEDLREIADHISRELLEPHLAEKLIDAIAEEISYLEDMPFRHGLVRDERLAAQGFRKLVIDNYVAFYAVAEKEHTVTIIRILHGRRDWINLI